MKKIYAAMMMAALVAAISVRAEEAAAPATEPAAPAAPAAPAMKVKKEMPPAEDLELTGTVAQQEKLRKNKAGVEIKQMVVVLEMADGGQVRLPANKKDGVDPAAFVGKNVKVFAKGNTIVNKKGKKIISLQKVVKIEPVAP